MPDICARHQFLIDLLLFTPMPISGVIGMGVKSNIDFSEINENFHDKRMNE